jgi:hypothetical protein
LSVYLDFEISAFAGEVEGLREKLVSGEEE